MLKDPTYIRELQLYLAYAGNSTLFDEPSSGPHWVSELQNSVPFAEAFDALAALPPTAARLPHEAGAPDFAWADNVGRSVVAKRGDERLFVTMQWRHDTASHTTPFAPTQGKPVSTNGVCRVQLTSATVDRLATVKCAADAGGELTTVHTNTHKAHTGTLDRWRSLTRRGNHIANLNVCKFFARPTHRSTLRRPARPAARQSSTPH